MAHSIPVRTDIIAIDGGTGSGTSANGARTGEILGCDWLSSGEIYRGITWDLILEGWTKPGIIAEPIEVARAAAMMNLEFAVGSVASVNGRECLGALHTDEINDVVPAVAAILPIREIVQGLVRNFTSTRGTSIVEGRATAWEIPGSIVKAWLYCEPKIAAVRHHSSVEDILRRNHQDETRDHFPMIQHPEAVGFDTTNMKVEDVSERIAALYYKARDQRYALK